MILGVYSRVQIEHLDFTEYPNHYVISITDPNKELAKIRQEESKILRVQFYDIDSKITVLGEGDYYPISDYDSDRIAEFVIKNYYDINFLAVHCEAGISRSAAVAAAISKFLSGNDDYYFKIYYPNKYVYSSVLNSFQILTKR